MSLRKEVHLGRRPHAQHGALAESPLVFEADLAHLRVERGIGRMHDLEHERFLAAAAPLPARAPDRETVREARLDHFGEEELHLPVGDEASAGNGHPAKEAVGDGGRFRTRSLANALNGVVDGGGPDERGRGEDEREKERNAAHARMLAELPYDLPMSYSLLPRLRIVSDDGTIVLGPGKADLLEAIGRTGSIRAAAEELEMSYMRAWSLVRTMNAEFRSPLVEKERGGSEKGGATLTERGRSVLALYRRMQERAMRAIEPLWGKMRKEL